MTFRRTAVVNRPAGSDRRFPGRTGPLPRLISALLARSSVGALVTMLITPPVDPRPNSSDDGPFRTSMESMLKVSRLYWPGSRAPSTNRSPRAENPRIVRVSPCAPPSPALIEIPGTLRTASRRVVMFFSSINSCGTTEIPCGVSWIEDGRRSSDGCLSMVFLDSGPVTVIGSSVSTCPLPAAPAWASCAEACFTPPVVDIASAAVKANEGARR